MTMYNLLPIEAWSIINEYCDDHRAVEFAKCDEVESRSGDTSAIYLSRTVAMSTAD